MERMASGIAGFDRLVQGGLPPEASVILQGPPGQEKLSFALTFLAEGLRTGGSGLVVLASQSPESLLRDLRRYGVDVETVARENRLRIVDWYSWGEETVTDIEERGVIVRSSVDLTNLGVAVSRGIATLQGDGPRRAVVEILSPAMNVYEVGQVYAFAQSTKRKLDRFHFTGVFLLENEMHTASVLTSLHQPFDGVIEIERTRIGDRIVRKIGVLHLKDTTPGSDFVPFEFTDQGIRIGPSPPPPPAEPAASPLPPRPSPSPRPSEARASRIGMVQEIARERLRIDPEDRDALFTLAAAQAVADDPRAAVRTLERLETIDPGYPGLWAFEMKLFARLGDAERWKRSREKALEASAESEGQGGSPCPFCKAPVSAGSAQCPHCMADLREDTDLFRGLEDLVRATVQEMVQEDHAAKPPPSVPDSARPRPAPRMSLKPVPKAKGLTNGLVLERRPLRPVPVAKTGHVNGLRGRTNGLTNGLRGRTNGLTNGLGHTNGLTNGLRGRTNGLTNGLGRTNGLTNGSGRTNGLRDGLGKAAGSRGFFGRRAPMWQRIALPAGLIVLVLLLPLVFFWAAPVPAYPIRVDGSFGDWASVSKVAAPPAVGPNPDIDIARVAVTDNLDFLAFYLEVRGNVLAGEPSGGQVTNAYYAFVDADRSRATGYQVQGIGADRLIAIDTWGGRVVGASISDFDESHGPRDWTGWTRVGSVQAAGSGGQLEFEVGRSYGTSPSSPVLVAFAARSWDGQTDASDVVVTDASSYVLVNQATQAPLILSAATPDVAAVRLHAVGAAIPITSVNVTLQGTFRASSLVAIDLLDETGALLSEQAPAAVTHFPLSGFVVPRDGNRTLSVRPRVGAPDGTTVGALVENVDDVVVGSGGVAFVDPGRVAASFAYVGAVPNAPVVDAGFSEWSNVSADGLRDVQPIWNPDLDLSGYAFRGASGSAYFMAELAGTALNGTMIPAANPSYVPPANGTGNGTVAPPPPPENGTDVIRMFLDADGSGQTGFSVGGLGADYLITITGKEGLILSSEYFRFSGGAPWVWNWTSLGNAPAAKDRSRIEASMPAVAVANASRAYFETTGWGGSHDDTSTTAPLQIQAGPMLVQTLSWSTVSTLALSPVTSGVGNAAGDEYGFNLTAVGRINSASGSNQSFVVGAPYASGGRGAVYLFFGYPGWSPANINAASANVTILGDTAGDHFGWCVGAAGDVNGDGIADFLVGAPDAGAGKAYLVYGRTGWAGVSGQAIGSIANVVTIAGQNSGDKFAASVAGVGNLDNAGNSDFAVGAYAYGSYKGRVYIFYGNGAVPSSANLASVFLDGFAAGDEFGFSVAGGGNVNGDSYADLVVGAPVANRAYVYTMGINPVTNGYFTASATGWTYGENDPNGYDTGAWDNVGGSGADLSGAGSYKLALADSTSTLTLMFHAEPLSTNTVSALALLPSSPDNGNLGTASVVTAAANGDHLILGNWTTPALGITTLPAGTWTFTYYAKAGSAITGHIDVHIFKKSSAGGLTAIDGTTGADNVDGVAPSTALGTNQAALTGTYAMASTGLASTDALVLRVYAHAVSVGGGQPTQKQITFAYDGSNANSNVVTTAAYSERLHFHLETGSVNGVSDRQMLTSAPDQATAQSISVSISAVGRYMVAEWVTPQLGVTSIPAGDWAFIYWGSDALQTTANFDVHIYKRSASGTLTPIDGTSGSNSTGGVAASGKVGTTAAGYGGTVTLGAIALVSTDAIVIRVYFNATANSGTRTATFEYDSASSDSVLIYPGTGFTDRLWVSSASSFTSPSGTYSAVRYRFSYNSTASSMGSTSYRIKYQIRDGADTTTVATVFDSGSLTTSQSWALHTGTVTGLVAGSTFRVRAVVEITDRYAYETPSISVHIDDVSLQFEARVNLTGSAGTNFGWSVALIGTGTGYTSFHNDAYAAVVVGSPTATSGQVSIYYGSASFSGTLGAGISGVASGDRFGYSVASGMDVNGDGIADLVVGAPYHTGGATASGSVYEFDGGSSTPPASAASANQIANGQNANEHFGWAVSSYSPTGALGAYVLAGAPHFGTSPNTNQGKAYVLAIPEFGDILVPIAFVLLVVVGLRRTTRRREPPSAWFVPRH